jgi:hypothetical protein
VSQVGAEQHLTKKLRLIMKNAGVVED